MTNGTETMVDFAGTLGVLCMLSILYGVARRRISDRRVARAVLGGLFGLAAVAQMHAPLEPYEGMLIDLRNVPLVLAGAFLGARGLVICAVVAILARLQIGGIGALAGVLGMLIAGGVGAAWHAATDGRPRGLSAFGTLGLMASASSAGVVMLPADLATWYLRNAAPVVSLLYLVVIPVVGVLIQRESDRLAEVARLRGAAALTARDVLLPQAALAWGLAHAGTVGSLRGTVECFALRLGHRSLIARLWSVDVAAPAGRALAARVAAHLPAGAVAGWAGPDLILIAIPHVGADESEALAARLRVAMVDEPVSVGGWGAIRLRLDVGRAVYPVLPPLDAILADLPPAAAPAGETATLKGPAPRRARRTVPAPRREGGGGELFATFDTLLAAKDGGWSRSGAATDTR